MLEGAATRLVDAHIHLWPDVTEPGLEWLGSEGLEVLNAPHTLDAYRTASSWEQRFVVVESQSTENEIAALEHAYRTSDEVVGIVPFLDLAGSSLEYLDRLAGIPAVTTVRDQVQHKGVGYLSSPGPARMLTALDARSLGFELVVTEGQWPEVLGVAAARPHQRFVLDHLGNPTGDLSPGGAWAGFLRAVAAHGGTMCKISGPVVDRLAVESPRALASAMEVVADAFGVERMIYGSNWPVSRLDGDLAAQQGGVLRALEAVFSGPEREAVLAGNALRQYGRHL